MKEIKIEVTQNCYRMCIHCSSDAKIKEYRNLDENFIYILLMEARELGANSVVFTGGEATLYPGIGNVIKRAKELGYYVKMYTMCNPNEETITLLDELNKLGLDEIIYSTSVALTRNNVITLDELKRFLPQVLEHTNLKLGIHHVITNQTLKDLDPALKMFLELPSEATTSFSVLRYIPHGRGDESLLLNNEELEDLKSYLKEQYTLYPDKIRLGSPWNILGITHTDCNAASENMIVGFDGNVYPCDAMKYFDYMGLAGNAHYISLKAIYDSQYFQKVRSLRDTASPECQTCHNFTLCKGGCLGQKMVAMIHHSITFEDYQHHALRTMNNFEDSEHVRLNGEMGLIGEIGELIDIFKKYETHSLNDDKKKQLRENIVYELGDITWYLAASLATFYQYNFADIASYLTDKKMHKMIDSDVLSACAKEKDPLCHKIHPGIPLSILDNKLPSYDISKDWKQLPLYACQIISSDSKEVVLQNASLILIHLAAVANHVLGMSFTDVINKNIEKLQKRYRSGFDEEIANSRIEEYDKYKKTEPVKEKCKRKDN